MSIKILPYKLGSGTAKALSLMLGTLRIHHDAAKSKYKDDNSDIIYNYGNSSPDYNWMPHAYDAGRLLNRPENIHMASDKVAFFHIVNDAIKEGEVVDCMVPDWTTQESVAIGMAESGPVYCRTLTRANQGRGIVVAHSPDEVVNAPLYVRGIMEVKREYRAHVFMGEVIDLVAKAIPSGDEADANQEIRSFKHGWVFVRDSVHIPDSIQTKLVNSSIEACEVVGLEVAAVDLVRDSADNVYVLEVNTAPGMEGTTLEKYAKELLSYEKRFKDGVHKPKILKRKMPGLFHGVPSPF